MARSDAPENTACDGRTCSAWHSDGNSDGQSHLLPAVICLVFELIVQIGTNFANDYLDGIKGTDTDVRLRPRRAVAAGLVLASTMKWAAIGILALAFCLGLNF